MFLVTLMIQDVAVFRTFVRPNICQKKKKERKEKEGKKGKKRLNKKQRNVKKAEKREKSDMCTVLLAPTPLSGLTEFFPDKMTLGLRYF